MMENSQLERAQDVAGAVWIVMVVVVFLGLPYGLPEVSVSWLEKVYALCLIGGAVLLARRATASSGASKGGRKRD
ncbi:MAG: hypothetical protein RMM08_01410 [Armatimonadota bacterium]|nr:hypothetical protein [bacterium]MDW8319994.1 hypothetical protein [Armatimonadota bacterium]